MKILRFVGSSKEDLSSMPDDVRQDFGYHLFKAQSGEFPATAKPLKGFGSASVIELRENWHGDTFRAVYTVQFKDCIYVLHCFKKKSSSGISTPKPDIELIKQRLKIAIDYEKQTGELK
jgi:phage-related protein